MKAFPRELSRKLNPLPRPPRGWTIDPERALRDQTSRLAKKHAIIITRSQGATGLYVTPPASISAADPWQNDHFAPCWSEAQRRVEAYAAMLPENPVSKDAQ